MIAPGNSNNAGSINAGVSTNSASNVVALNNAEVINAVTPVAASVASTLPATSSAIGSISTGPGMNSANISTTFASSVLSAYQMPSSVAESFTPYETISQTIANSGALNPLGNVTFSTTNIPMSCINGYGCGGSSSSATINSHSFVFNFQNATVTNNYNISYSNFNGYTGTITGANAATAINWSSSTVVSLPVTGQVSANPVSAAMDTVLTSVGTQGLTNRANLATVYTTISSGGNYMGVGNGYKILGK